MPEPILLIHGGAGTLSPDRLTADKRAAVITGLKAALEAGQRILAQGGPALDGAIAAVSALEDDPSFNAGRGAVFTSAAKHEMDASVMDGATKRAGAIAGIVGPRNPVQAARLVMERSGHVFLAGPAAIDFLRGENVTLEPEAYFSTDDRRRALDEFLTKQGAETDDYNRHGTVGAVALDAQGHLAAATSTGGMTGKLPGRIGDTPVIGAGTWADEHCAMSATGHGESFIRVAAAHELSARLRFAHQPLDEAAAAVLAEVEQVGGDGGFIALDRHGNAVLPFNTRGMYRGQATGSAPPRVAIYGESLS
jgi:L-asparaginase / beta-aspartyl-peptidase